LIGKVTVWQMTEDERQEYIKKHPIKEIKKSKRSSTINYIDYQWRSDKAVAARNKKINNS
jgi:hypothetical protein